MKKIIFVLILLMMVVKPVTSWDDFTLLSSGGNYSILKPNIMILLSNSETMNHLIYHEDYNPNGSYTEIYDGIWPGQEHTITQYNAGTYDSYFAGAQSFVKGYYLHRLGVTQLVHQLTPVADHDGVFQLDVAANPYHSDPGSLSGAHPIYLFGEPDGSNEVRIDGSFLNFMVYDATAEQRAAWNHFMLYGTWDTSDTTNIDGDYGMERKVRIRVARLAMIETVNSVFADYYADTNPEKGYPRIGLAEFNDEIGAHMTHDCAQSSNPQSFESMIKSMEAEAKSPLSEAYAELWSYFRLGGTGDITNFGQFKPFPDCGPIASSPISNWCQLNFIVVVTDGMPTRDTQLRDLTSDTLFYIPPDNSCPWGDTDGSSDDVDTATTADDGTFYLDDLAAFAFREDLYPDDISYIKNSNYYDTVYKDKQFIYTYVVGFSADNDYLRKTAENGGGDYFTAKDYDSLARAMKNVMASIEEKVRAYAAFAAPKYSLTYGDRRGYVATFVPKNEQHIWEGHLKAYTLDADGNFPDLENPGSAFLWDAGLVLNNRTSARNIMTAKNASFVDFTTGTSVTDLPPADFGFNSGDAAVDKANRDTVIDFIRGNNGYNWLLGDIFHFNPVVVGAPLKWKASFDASYALFFDALTDIVTDAEGNQTIVSNRTEVVYAGANDGMLHCFSVETGEELWAFIPPSLLPKLRDVVEGVPGNVAKSHQYFVDGKAIVKDVKVANNGTWDDWRTILVFALGMGGSSYCALDITDPANPVFLWEFDDPVYMGYSEGKPVIADIGNDGNGLMFPAAILSGGYDKNENPATTSLTGKAFYVLHAYDGTLIKKFTYGATTSDPDTQPTGSYYLHTNSDFIYPFTATPVALDQNYDGIADYVYMCETGDYLGSGHGGRIWKVSLGGNPQNWRPTKIFQADSGQTLFIPPTLGFDRDFHLWVLFGTGHRPQPNDADNQTGQFIGFVDNGNISTPLGTSDLLDITGAFTTPGTDQDFSLDSSQTNYNEGFYFDFVKASGEMLFEPNPVFINSQVFLNTYAPISRGSVTDPCQSQGNQFVYNFSISSTGTNIYLTDSQVVSGKIQGYGALSGGRYKIYIGEGEVGSPTIKSQETVDLTDTFGVIFWVEKKK
jgi:type IV pilus assembly protein PilY1